MAKAKPQKAEVIPQDITLPVQTSQLKLENESLKLRPTPSNLEIGISSWSPDAFSRSTYSNGEVNFGSGSYPFVSANYVSPLAASTDGFGFHWKLGFASVSLKRSVTVSHYTRTYEVEQKLTLVSARLGVEWRGARILTRTLQPLLGFSVLPTLAVSPKSQIEGNVSERGYPFEAVGGVIIHPKYLFGDSRAFEDSSMGVVAQYIFDSVESSKMEGMGVLGFVRFAL
jgi:hypothetical protein